MKRLVTLCAVVALFVTLAIAAFASAPSRAQTGDEATIEAQETRITELEATIAVLAGESALPDADATPEPEDEPAEFADESPYLGGTGLALLPTGAADEVEVVLQGVYDGSSLPIIVQNGSDEPIGQITVTAAVRSAAGDLIGAGGDGGFNPSRVEPGSYAIGYLYFDGADLPATATYEFDVSFGAPESGSFSSLDMTIVEVAFLSDRIVGELRNDHDALMEGPINIAIICLTEDGEIVGYESGYTDQDSADAGESIPFQVSLFGDTECANFVIAASGYNF